MILVIVPTLGRPHKLRELADNISSATVAPVTTLFVTEPGDTSSALAAEETGAMWCTNTRKACYAGALNSGYASMDAYFPSDASGFTHMFAAADDLHFSPGWDEPALALCVAQPQIRVVGTNDLHNPYVLAGEHATAYLIDRRYIDLRGGVVDEPAGIVHCEKYDHNYADTEFIETAKMRGVFAPCLDSVVEHLHPVWGRGEWDEGYTRSHAGMARDGEMFAHRQHLWAA